MKLVIGGAFQGKLSYAKKTWQIEDGWIDGADCALEEIDRCRGIYHFHEYIRRMLLEQEDTGEALTEIERNAALFAEHLARQNPDILIVSNELGYGIVPMDKFDRRYREMAGRVCTCIAAQAEEVVRVVCGIGSRLK